MATTQTITEIDPAFFFTPEYEEMYEYEETYEDSGSMALDGIIFTEFGYVRYFNVNYLGSPALIPMVMNVEADAQLYVVTTKGTRITLSLDEAIPALCSACGISVFDDIETIHEISDYVVGTATGNVQAYITDDGRLEVYIDRDGIQHFYKQVAEHVYACLIDMFGTETPMVCPYNVIQKRYLDGQGYIIDWDNSNVGEICGGLTWDNGQISSYVNGLELNTWIDSLMDLDELHRKIFACPIVRVIFWTPSYPGHFHCSIIGLTIENNSIVTSSDSGADQHYAGLVLKSSGVRYERNNYDDPILLVSSFEDESINSSVVFYNSPHSGWYNYKGHTATPVHNGTAVDSIGYSVTIKPYEIIGITPNLPNMADNYPSWTPNPYDDYPVSDPDPDEPDPQPYAWRGIPSPYPKPVPPYISIPPLPYPDPEPDESTSPSVTAIEGTYGLFTVYKASVTDLLTIGNFLWDRTIIDELLETFTNDPFGAIISLHQLYFDPVAPNTRALKLGLTQVKSNGADFYLPYINDRYQSLACGNIAINRFFNDIRDYQTTITIYLPFIGMRQLDVNEIMNGTLYVAYYVDTYTGDCLCTLMVTRDSMQGKVLYTFNGNCASELPLTAADRSRMLSNAVNIGTGLVKTIMTKGMGASSLVNAIAGSVGHNVEIEKSGSMGGNVGAMGFKKPYLIISRPQPYDAVDRGRYEGYPVNLTTVLGGKTGYVRVREVHVDNIPNATDQEKEIIKSLLLEGIRI